MSNLIITVISILLVAVAALVAIYYGGTAFYTSAAHAKAATLLQQTQQIFAAWQSWSADNGGRYDPGDAALTMANTPPASTTNFLVPQYLTQITNLSNMGTQFAGGTPFWWFVGYPTITVSVNLPVSRPARALRIKFAYSDDLYQVCQEYVKIIFGPNAAIGNNTPNRDPGDCYWQDANADGIKNTGDAMNFMYRVF